LAKGNLTTEEINNFLLATNNEGYTVWHMAVDRGRKAAFKEIWDLAKDS
jgi:endo-1,4-beta-D-glucanase Y